MSVGGRDISRSLASLVRTRWLTIGEGKGAVTKCKVHNVYFNMLEEPCISCYEEIRDAYQQTQEGIYYT